MLPFSVASIKAFHKWFSQQSLAMYHEETDTPMKVRPMDRALLGGVPPLSPPQSPPQWCPPPPTLCRCAR